MAFNRSPIFRIIVALTVLALPFAAFAKDDVGKASGGGTSIEWQLKVTGHDRVDVTVLGPDGTTWSKSFSAGKNPSIRLSDLGNPEDGQYNVELRVVPNISDDVKSKLKAARVANDEAAARKIMKDAKISAPVQSTTFTIANGFIVSTDLVEADSNDAAATTTRGISTNAVAKPRGIAVEDQVIPDDLIVQSSLCVGFDCVDGESFGVDTIRMKENNTRLNFDDTSTSAGFAANDWRIVANDQPSGGASYLAFEDSTAGRQTFKVEAGAPANALYVDSTGNIGISQSAPGLDLHMTTTDTPGVRFEQTSGGGFTAQTWDVAGNEANFFIRDLTGGSRLSFRIRPGAPTSSVDIAADGDVGIGTGSPAARLHIEADTLNPGAGQSSILVKSANNEDAIVGLGSGPSFSDNVDGFLFGYNGAAGVGRGFIGTRPTTGTGEINIAVKNSTIMKVVSTGIEVTGSIKVNNVTMSVPDFVFADDYKLMPIDELKAFITANKHLPNVPSEKEIKANGLDLGEFHMSLLRKVEELTLYTVAQDETIKQLQNRLSELEAQKQQ